ncbi:hypothetical protein VIBR0546_08837, partial [Vibrio brasiliensis LMG 20546]
GVEKSQDVTVDSNGDFTSTCQQEMKVSKLKFKPPTMIKTQFTRVMRHSL